MAITNPLPEILEFTDADTSEGDFKVSLNKLLLFLREVVGTNGERMIPSGLIAMWAGSADDIPDGWALCDGQNGTVDLRDKFVIGAGSSYAVNDSGGSASQSVTLSGNVGDTTLTVSQMPSHSHTLMYDCVADSDSSYPSLVSAYKYRTSSTNSTGGSGSHTHSLSGSYNVSVLPPYYAKCFIQKL